MARQSRQLVEELDDFLKAKPRLVSLLKPGAWIEKGVYKKGDMGAVNFIMKHLIPEVRAGAKQAWYEEQLESDEAAVRAGRKKHGREMCMERWEGIAKKRVRMEHAWRGAQLLKVGIVGLSLHQLSSAMDKDEANQNTNWGRNTWRAIGENLGGVAVGAGGAMLFRTAGGMAGGYLGSIYGGRIADGIYDSVANRS